MHWSNPWKLKGWRLWNYVEQTGCIRVHRLKTARVANLVAPALVRTLMRAEYRRGYDKRSLKVRLAMKTLGVK